MVRMPSYEISISYAIIYIKMAVLWTLLAVPRPGATIEDEFLICCWEENTDILRTIEPRLPRTDPHRGTRIVYFDAEAFEERFTRRFGRPDSVGKPVSDLLPDSLFFVPFLIVLCFVQKVLRFR